MLFHQLGLCQIFLLTYMNDLVVYQNCIIHCTQKMKIISKNKPHLQYIAFANITGVVVVSATTTRSIYYYT